MTAPQQSCPRCHLYLSARGCTPERCANPEGAAEIELSEALKHLPPGLRDGDPVGFVCGRCGWQGPRPMGGETLTGWRDRMATMKPPSDLDAFRAMLERAGVGHDVARVEEGTAFLFPMALMDVAHRFVFSTDGKLLRADDQEINLPDGDE